MDRKFMLVALLFIVVSFCGVLVWKKTLPVETAVVPNDETVGVVTIPVMTDKPMLKEIELKKTTAVKGDVDVEKASTESAILKELQNRQYSEDPIVEMESIVFQHFQCLPDLEALLFFGQQATDAALAQVKKARLVCPEFMKQYPVISDIDEYKKHKEALVPNSKYGRLKKQRDLSRSQSELMSDEVLAAVETKSGPVIAASGLGFRYGMRYEPITMGQNIFKSTDRSYHAYIISLATQKLSCEFQNGVSCGSNSFFMLQKCVADEKHCGVDFQTWYHQVTMPGQQKDVALVIDYLKQKVNEE
ncbi:hypothetical protein [Marinicella rhabdoformis]|uniref:hypothetical protein n=1 Tax=Marinicella rhabdoformis TaxID=2580566 RepID=UPI0012AEC566|nr:hypothetical protein [Marinicella rhabdoformis]